MPTITLSSDIGEQDFVVAAIKGELLKANGAFSIVDISHRLTPFNYYQAYYVIKNAIAHFPEDTFHLLLLNLFDDKPKRLLLAEQDGKYFGCADNGLLTMILDGREADVVSLPLRTDRLYGSFEMVNVFADAFNEILAGKTPGRIGARETNLKFSNPLKPMLGNDWIEGQIIFVDNFENVIVNITREQFEEQRKGRSFQIVFRRDEMVDKICGTYADVPEGEKLALFNAAGYLEIAINKGNAAGLFGLQGFSETQNRGQQPNFSSNVFYQTVKVYFK